MDKNIGYVYILTNPCYKEDIVKIGITSGTVRTTDYRCASRF